MEEVKTTYLDGCMKLVKKYPVGNHVKTALHMLELAEFDDRHGTNHFDYNIRERVKEIKDKCPIQKKM